MNEIEKNHKNALPVQAMKEVKISPKQTDISKLFFENMSDIDSLFCDDIEYDSDYNEEIETQKEQTTHYKPILGKRTKIMFQDSDFPKLQLTK